MYTTSLNNSWTAYHQFTPLKKKEKRWNEFKRLRKQEWKETKRKKSRRRHMEAEITHTTEDKARAWAEQVIASTILRLIETQLLRNLTVSSIFQLS